MSDRLRYGVELGVTNGADVEEIENFLQQVLLDLYEQGEVEEIRVTKDGHTEGADDVYGLIDTLDSVDAEHIRRTIDSAHEFEQLGDDDDE